MEINLIDQILLLTLNDDTGNYDVEPELLNHAIAASIILLCTSYGKIKLENDRVIVIDEQQTNDRIVDPYLAMFVEHTTSLSLRKWVRKILKVTEEIKTDALQKMISGGVLEKKEEKIMWVFSVDTFPTHNLSTEEGLRERLDLVITDNQAMTVKEAMLLGVIKYCGMVDHVFPSEKRKVYHEKMFDNFDDRLGSVEDEEVVKLCKSLEYLLPDMLSAEED